jgi:hypothetical protein
MTPGRTRRRGPSCLLGCALSAVLASVACNERFMFDTADAAAGSSAAAGQAGASPPAGGSPAAAGGPSQLGGNVQAAAAGTTDSPADGSCGDQHLCPTPLRCDAGKCYECADDIACSPGSLPRCDPARHRCVACLDASDCGPGFTCDALANRCLQICAANRDCALGAHGCDERRGVCYQCDEDRECATSASGPLCASDGSGCVQCRSDQDCPGRHCDELLGHCVDCRDGSDCATGLCDPTAGQCLTE